MTLKWMTLLLQSMENPGKMGNIKFPEFYHTEDGNDWQKIENFLEFMKNRKMKMNGSHLLSVSLAIE